MMKMKVHSFARLALQLSFGLGLGLSLTPQLHAGVFNAGSDLFANAPVISDDADYSGADVSATTSLIAFTSQGGEPTTGLPILQALANPPGGAGARRRQGTAPSAPCAAWKRRILCWTRSSPFTQGPQ